MSDDEREDLADIDGAESAEHSADASLESADVAPEPDDEGARTSRDASPEEIAEYLTLLAGVDWSKAERDARQFARKRLPRGASREADAEDIAATAIEQTLDPLYAWWDPAKNSIDEHLRSKVNRLVYNLTHSAGEQTRKDAPKKNDVEQVKKRGASVEHAMGLSELVDKCAALVEERFGAKALVIFRNLDAAPRDLAKELDMTPAQVRDLKHRLIAYCRKALEAQGVQRRDVLERRPKDPVLVALERRLEASLPKRARRSPIRLSSAVLPIVVILLVSAMGWFACHGR
jgi:hypothetical protein